MLLTISSKRYELLKQVFTKGYCTLDAELLNDIFETKNWPDEVITFCFDYHLRAKSNFAFTKVTFSPK